MLLLKTHKSRIVADAILVLAILAIAAVGLSRIPWLAPDWENIYRPGALNLVAPNSVAGNYAAPWTYVILWPIAALPDWLSKGALTLATLAIVYRYMGDGKKFLFACLSMPVIVTVAFGQVDAISLLALIVPAELSLVLMACKPQGVAVAALRRLSWWSVCILLAVFVLSVAVWGDWFSDVLTPLGLGTNVSGFPFTIPIGLWFLWREWKNGFKSDAMLCVATLMLTPYFFYGSLLPAFCAAIKETSDGWDRGVLVGASWLYLLAATLLLGVGL